MAVMHVFLKRHVDCVAGNQLGVSVLLLNQSLVACFGHQFDRQSISLHAIVTVACRALGVRDG